MGAVVFHGLHGQVQTHRLRDVDQAGKMAVGIYVAPCNNSPACRDKLTHQASDRKRTMIRRAIGRSRRGNYEVGNRDLTGNGSNDREILDRSYVWCLRILTAALACLLVNAVKGITKIS